jgi:GAF domain-containing protein
MKLGRRRKQAPPPPAEDLPVPPASSLATELLAEIQAEVRVIRTMASTLRSADRVQLAAQSICEIAVELLDVESALVNLVNGKSQLTVAKAGLTAFSTVGELPIENSFCPIVVGTGHELAVTDAQNDPRVNGLEIVRNKEITSYLGVPLRTEDELVIGALCVCGCTPRVWSERDQAILESLSRRLMMVEAEALRQTL